MLRKILEIGILGMAIAFIFTPQPVHADWYFSGGVWIWDPWDWWDYDDCYCNCCWNCNWWYSPYWNWCPCRQRIVRIYYSPCGWYRYEYYPYHCSGCDYVYVEGRYVWRRPVRLRRRYSYSDMGSEFVRRRGLGSATSYRSTTGPSGSSSGYSTSRERGSSTSYSDMTYRTSSNDSWHRSKSVETPESSSSSSSSSYIRERDTRSAETISPANESTSSSRERSYDESSSRESSSSTTERERSYESSTNRERSSSSSSERNNSYESSNRNRSSSSGNSSQSSSSRSSSSKSGSRSRSK